MSDPKPVPSTIAPEPPALSGVPQPAYADAPVRKRRGLGIWSFVLALLAVLGDVAVVVLAIVGAGSFTVGDGSAAGLLLAALALGAVAYFGGFLVAGLAILLGILGLVLGRGRVLSVLGILLALAVLATHIAIGGGFTGILEGISGGIPGV